MTVSSPSSEPPTCKLPPTPIASAEVTMSLRLVICFRALLLCVALWCGCANGVALARDLPKPTFRHQQLRETLLLAQLRSDVPLGQKIQTGVLDEDAKQRTRLLFERWELKSLLPRLSAL